MSPSLLDGMLIGHIVQVLCKQSQLLRVQKCRCPGHTMRALHSSWVLPPVPTFFLLCNAVWALDEVIEMSHLGLSTQESVILSTVTSYVSRVTLPIAKRIYSDQSLIAALICGLKHNYLKRNLTGISLWPPQSQALTRLIVPDVNSLLWN